MTRLSLVACVVILVASLVLTRQQLRVGAYPGSLTSALIMASVIVQQTGQRNDLRRQATGWTFLGLALAVLLGQIAQSRT